MDGGNSDLRRRKDCSNRKCRPLDIIIYGKTSFLLCFVLAYCGIAASADSGDFDYDDEGEKSTTAKDPINLLEGLGGLGPYIFGLLFAIFVTHLLVQPNWLTIDLMQVYLHEGTQIPGTVLDCELRPATTDRWLVNVMWECMEHKYADNASLKFRNPGAFELKRFARRFEFHQEMEVGSFVHVILPRDTIQPRSGCPTAVIERILAQESAKSFQIRAALGVGIVAVSVLVGLSAVQINQMDDPHHGWIVLLVCLLLIEAASFLYCADQFLKKKARVFDGAKPMVSVAEQQQRREKEAATPGKTVDPFSIPLNEFAGHARATERRR